MRFSHENEYFNRSLLKANFRNFSLEAEIGTKNDFFYEFGVKYREYRYSFSVKFNWYPEQHPKFRDGIMIYGGYGKRISLRNTNLNIINVQAGISLFTPFSRYNGGIIADPTFDQGYDFDYNFTQYEILTKNRIIPSLYIGISKDIRVYKRFYVTMSYRYDQGFISTYQQKFRYVNNSSETEEVDNNITGTAHALMFSFKYRILPMKYRD